MATRSQQFRLPEISTKRSQDATASMSWEDGASTSTGRSTSDRKSTPTSRSASDKKSTSTTMSGFDKKGSSRSRDRDVCGKNRHQVAEDVKICDHDGVLLHQLKPGDSGSPTSFDRTFKQLTEEGAPSEYGTPKLYPGFQSASTLSPPNFLETELGSSTTNYRSMDRVNLPPAPPRLNLDFLRSKENKAGWNNGDDSQISSREILSARELIRELQPTDCVEDKTKGQKPPLGPTKQQQAMLGARLAWGTGMANCGGLSPPSSVGPSLDGSAPPLHYSGHIGAGNYRTTSSQQDSQTDVPCSSNPASPASFDAKAKVKNGMKCGKDEAVVGGCGVTVLGSQEVKTAHRELFDQQWERVGGHEQLAAQDPWIADKLASMGKCIEEPSYQARFGWKPRFSREQHPLKGLTSNIKFLGEPGDPNWCDVDSPRLPSVYKERYSETGRLRKAGSSVIKAGTSIVRNFWFMFAVVAVSAGVAGYEGVTKSNRGDEEGSVVEDESECLEEDPDDNDAAYSAQSFMG